MKAKESVQVLNGSVWHIVATRSDELFKDAGLTILCRMDKDNGR